MNCLQIMRQARSEVDALRSGGTVHSGMWIDEEVLAALNTSMNRTARLLRLAGSDLLTKTMNSGDANQDLITESYDPSSLALVDGTTDYTLPPDFVRLVSLRITTAGYEGVVFKPSSLNSEDFITQRSIPVAELGSGTNRDMVFSYVIIGARTLRLAPTPRDAVAIELVYHYRPPRLRFYNTGTVTTAASTSVTGSGTSWLSVGLRTPADFLSQVTATTGVSMDAYYAEIASIETNTALTLSRSFTGTTGSGQTYYIAMTPTLPEEHHTWLAQLTAATMLRKVDADLSAKLQADLAMQLLEGVTPEVTLRQLQESLIAEAFEIR